MNSTKRTPLAVTHVNDTTGPPNTENVETCSLCGSRQLDLRFTAQDTLHGMPGEWGVVKCTDCGLMHTSPRPTRESIASFYPASYQPHAEHFAPSVEQGRLRRVLRRILDPKEIVIPDRDRPRRVLEVGCGSGRTLAELAGRGWEVHGLEPSSSAVEILKTRIDLPVSVGTIEEADYEPGSFDVIIASMVLEHLHEPPHDASRLRKWLKPGGILTGSVPNCASWEFRFFKAEWYALQVPTHLFHFTPATLTRLLEQAGFDHIRIYHQRNVSNLMIHLGRFLERRHLPFSQTCLAFPERGSRTLRLAVRPAASVLAWLGHAGRMSFVADRS